MAPRLRPPILPVTRHGRAARLAAATALALLAVSCGAGMPGQDDPPEPPAAPATRTPQTPPSTAAATPAPTTGDGHPGDAGAGDADAEDERAGQARAAAAAGANELGAVPVIMYHRVLPEGGGDYDLTPEEFRGELERLYEQGYRPVRAVDLARGRIDLPAGTSPVVLTFDDGSREQFAYGEDGEVAADTAIGMLLDFAEEHPEFSPVASLYVNAEPFGGGATRSAAMLADLHERGFELGNHSHGHTNLGSLEPDEVRRELAEGAAAITAAVPGAEVATLSLPFGVLPEDPALAVAGSWEGREYTHEGVFLVGAGPAPSPFDREFDAAAIPRIRASPSWPGGEPDYGSAFWLDWLAAEPGRRYVSDGDPDTVAFPEALAGELDPDQADRAVGY